MSYQPSFPKFIHLCLAIVCGLGCVGCENSVHQLADQLRNGNQEVRYLAARKLETLAEQGTSLTEALPALNASLTDTDPKVRYRAMKSLAKIGQQEGIHLDTVAQVLIHDEDPDVKYYAAKVIYHGGDAREAVLPALLQAIEAKNREDVLCYVAKSLGKIGPNAKSALPKLTQLARGANPELQRAATNAIRRIRESTIAESKKDS